MTRRLSFQYPNLGSSLCNSQLKTRSRRSRSSFQYPNLGSSLCNSLAMPDFAMPYFTFSILTSDRLSVTAPPSPKTGPAGSTSPTSIHPARDNGNNLASTTPPSSQTPFCAKKASICDDTPAKKEALTRRCRSGETHRRHICPADALAAASAPAARYPSSLRRPRSPVVAWPE